MKSRFRRAGEFARRSRAARLNGDDSIEGYAWADEKTGLHKLRVTCKAAEIKPGY